MRSNAVVAAALVAGAAASPLGAIRNIFAREYVTDYTYVTTTVYVTAGSEPTTVEAAAVSSSTPEGKKWSWKHKTGYGYNPATTVVTSAAAETSVAAPAPETTIVVSSVAEAVPTTTETPTSVYVPPVESSVEAVSTVTEAQATPTSAYTSAAASATSAPSTGNSYADSVVKHHNVHRANHSASDLTWSASLASTALKIAQTCNYAHNVEMDGGGYGQNIAAGCPSDNVTSVITDLFYNGEVASFAPYYGQDTPEIPGTQEDWDNVFHNFGHFTQIVWKGTTEVGCATYDCTGAGNGPNGLGNVDKSVPPYFTVCNYKSAGNYLGEFADNVGKPLGNPTVGWDY